ASYAVGNALIDEQHRELFRMSDDLVEAMRGKDEAGRVACARAVEFLKEYVVRHFADEEALQADLGYEDLPRHRQLHRDFIDTVAGYERSLAESGFDPAVMQRFAGKLIGWLIYHVVGEDRKIMGAVAAAPQAVDRAVPAQLVSYFADSACEVLGQMLNLPFRIEDAAPTGGDINDISVRVGLLGDRPGTAEFVFPLVTALRIVRNLTMVDPDDFDEMVESALREIANIISGNAASGIAETGLACDITPPKLSRGLRAATGGGKLLRCDLGAVSILLSEDTARA
ncbi:MAG: chemotaxis protein CheX, partial [Clostridiales Family XIII bacterium]|nr:chemotaxis protein CheX [Clostridiales Family XIII bacterium]